MINILKIIEESLAHISNPRTREILVRRFGLRDGQRKTLEAIGKDHNITRERVRQIEEAGLDTLRQSKIMGKLDPVFKTFHEHLSDHGALKKEETLYDDLTYVCYPAKEIERLQREGKAEELSRCRSSFYFILTLGDNFERMPESEHFYSAWTNNKNAIRNAKQAVDSLVKHFNSQEKVLNREELFAVIKNLAPDLSDKAIHSYVDVSRHIEKNYLGNFGLAHWPEISPRGVKDKAYIILKNAGRPMHFSEVTKAINKDLASGRQAYIQTVHNELIKDKRFVLVGRGLYALADWGYEPGTVAEIIKSILQKDGLLGKEEILKKVLEKRLVKENTVLINLQNRKLFERDNQNRYAVKK